VDAFYPIAFGKKIYPGLEERQGDIDEWGKFLADKR